MVRAAAAAHRGLFERAQPRRRLARVEDCRSSPLDSIDEPSRERRDPGQAAEHVERDALAAKNRSSTSADDCELTGLEPIAIEVVGLPSDLSVELPEYHANDIEAADDAGLLQQDRGGGTGLGRHEGQAGDVAGANVFGQPGTDVGDHRARSGVLADHVHRSSTGDEPGRRTVCNPSSAWSESGKSVR